MSKCFEFSNREVELLVEELEKVRLSTFETPLLLKVYKELKEAIE